MMANRGPGSVVARARRAPALARSYLPRSLLGRLASPPLLAFVHIPKTAGATATSMFTAAYSSAEVYNAGNHLRSPERTPARVGRRQWAGRRVMVGHVPYGIYREHLPADARYMTFLREPVDRVLSHYYRHRPRKQSKREQPGRVSGGKITTASLEEALAAPPLAELSNLATRFLCSDPSPMGELPASALDDAKANLREFAFVGIQERFVESTVLLQRTLGLGLVPYLNRHVGLDRPAAEEIPAEQRRLIEECNRLDAELYAFALDLFEDAMPIGDQSFATDVERLRGMSADLNEQAIQHARDWLDCRDPAETTKPTAALYFEAEAAGIPEPALKHVLGSRRREGATRGEPRPATRAD
jgi:Sulfotransferase family